MSFTDPGIEESGDYLKLKGGEVVNFHILSTEPMQLPKSHWENKVKTVCSGKDCAMCAKGNKAKQRWTIEVWDRKDQKVKKLEYGPKISNDIKEIADMLKETNQEMKSIDIRIKTTGSGLETEYAVLNIPKSAEVIPEEVLIKYELPF